MKIENIFDEKKVVLSFEIFPPKPTSKIDTVYKTIEELAVLNPDFISVTYGSGGTMASNRTVELSSLIKEKYNIETIAHLTCINSTEDDIMDTIKKLKANNIENILSLRGDIPTDKSSGGSFKYATDLIKFVKANSDLSVSGACYPEGHVQNKNLDQSIEIMKMKEDLGADHFISQMFFCNDAYYDFMNRVYRKNIKSPIEAGIMPVTNRKQIERMVQLSGASFPYKLLKIIDKYEDSPEALEQAGISYATEQIIDLVSSGIRGIHLYTMNKPQVAKKIVESIKPIFAAINK